MSAVLLLGCRRASRPCTEGGRLATPTTTPDAHDTAASADSREKEVEEEEVEVEAVAAAAASDATTTPAPPPPPPPPPLLSLRVDDGALELMPPAFREAGQAAADGGEAAAAADELRTEWE